MNEKQPPQTSLTFFQPDRRLLGCFWVAKRVMAVLTIGSLVDSNIVLASILVGLREALSAVTDYSVPRDPIATTQQSSPPNPASDVETGT